MKAVTRRIIISVVLVLMTFALCVGISAKELDVGIPVEEYPELFMDRTMPTHGEGRIAVFLIQFPDCHNENQEATAKYYQDLYFSAENLGNSADDDPWRGSVAAFYREQSFGKLNLSGQVFEWYTAKHERSYYNETWRKAELVMEAVAYFEAKGVDFNQFDGDGNGEIDAITYHFAGPVDTEQGDPWYGGVEYAMNLGETEGHRRINSFIQVSNEVDRAASESRTLRRTICHELMHTLGMYDLYGTAWFALEPVEDLMTTNQPLINPYYKMLLGWTKNVTLVTEDTLDISLGEWASTGETLLVTDRYNGIFDEFYMIAYTQYNALAEGEIRIWHVDARLNADKTAFLYDNLSYVPKPGENAHHVEGSHESTYLFMEEISAIPQYDNVLNKTNNLYFREGSTLGPNSIPSTDSHDGRYVGIKIDDFKRSGSSASMDITFGHKDTAAPQVSETLSVLGFTAENKLRFNEYIYPSNNWAMIQITTLDGVAIPAKFTRNHYSVHEIEIAVEGTLPQEGYLIVLPENCVRDSSGNQNEAKTVQVMPDGYIFVQSSTFIPWYHENEERKFENDIHCFSDQNESILITSTGEGKNEAAYIEFLKTDAKGNILIHKFILNPYEERYFPYVYRANDGSYIIPLYSSRNRGVDCVMCIDRDGNLRWHKASEVTLSETCIAYENGLLFYDNGNRNVKKIVFIDAKTGDITLREPETWGTLRSACYNGKDLVYLSGAKGYLCAYVADPLTQAVKNSRVYDVDASIDYGREIEIVANNDGTYTAVITTANSETGKDGILAMHLSADLDIIKEATIDATPTQGRTTRATFYPDDGFSVAVCVSAGNHSDTTYHVVRMDKNLNLMWETDIVADQVSFFVTASNKICAFASYWSPAREAYLLNYGSEDSFEVIVHTMTHHPARTATCAVEGQTEHWTCTVCGGCFADAEGETAITAASVVLPKTAHTAAACADSAPTCTANGSTGGTYCSVCNAELTAKTVIPATGHIPVNDPAVAPTCTATGSKEGAHCSVCLAVLIPQTVIPATGHTAVTDPAVAPTCTENGLSEGSHCSICLAVLTPQTAIHAKGHTVVEDAAVEPTSERDGLTAGSHCGDCGVVLVAQKPVSRQDPAETTEAPATTQVPETDVPVTEAPVTTEPETTGADPITEPEQTTEQNFGLSQPARTIAMIVIAIAALGLLVLIAIILQRWI